MHWVASLRKSAKVSVGYFSINGGERSGKYALYNEWSSPQQICVLQSWPRSSQQGTDCECAFERTPSRARTNHECSLSYRRSQAAVFQMKNVCALSPSTFCISEPHLTWHRRAGWCHLPFCVSACQGTVTGGSPVCLPPQCPLASVKVKLLFSNLRKIAIWSFLLSHYQDLSTQFSKVWKKIVLKTFALSIYRSHSVGSGFHNKWWCLATDISWRTHYYLIRAAIQDWNHQWKCV